MEDCFWCPVLEETEYFCLIIAFALLQEAWVLNVNHFTVFTKDYENGEAETATIV